MAQPVAYTPVHTFLTDSAGIPLFPGQAIDVELNAIKSTTDQVRTNLALIQRDDGRIANGSVTYDSLDPALTAGGIYPLSLWATGTKYVINQVIVQSTVLYKCAISHTAGVFATDLLAGDWTLLATLPIGPQGIQGPSGTSTFSAFGMSLGLAVDGPAAQALIGFSPSTTNTLTNKTFDTAATGNSLSINGVAATANTGTGSVVRATSPTLVTPTLGAALATTINGITLSASSGTLTLNTNTFAVAGAGVSFIISGTAGTLSFQGTDTYVGRATTDTLTNKTINGASNTLTVLGASQISGNIPVTNLNSGTSASSASFWRGDGTWAPAPGTGTVTSIVAGAGMTGGTITTSGTIARGSGGRILLATLTASASPTLSDTSSLTATYSRYVLVFENLVPATNTVSIELQVHTAAAFPATSYLATTTLTSIGAALASTSPTTFIALSNTNVANTGQGLSGEVFVENPSNTTTRKMWWGSLTYFQSTNNGGRAEIMGWWDGGNGAIDGFQVLASAGNLTSGTIKIYGIVN